MEFKYFDWKCKLEIKVECVKRNYNSELSCACDLKLEYRSDTWSTHNGGVKERNESERESMCVWERERERECEKVDQWSIIRWAAKLYCEPLRRVEIIDIKIIDCTAYLIALKRTKHYLYCLSWP